RECPSTRRYSIGCGLRAVFPDLCFSGGAGAGGPGAERHIPHRAASLSRPVTASRAAGGYLEYPADTHSGRGRDDTPRGSLVFGAQANGSKCSCCASAYSFYVYCINGY
ncbi:MAG: hypothetical protein ACK5RA_05645, partial [Cyanobacteriota bacterium]